MATGLPKTRWNGKDAHLATSHSSENSPDVFLGYEGKRTEASILATRPATTLPLWEVGSCQEGQQITNRLYYGDNLPILAALLKEPAIRGNIQLIYIDPPFATNSVFQSRSQGDAYSDILVGVHYIEFLRERLILLRELLAKDGSIYVHLDQNMAFPIKIIMDEIFGRNNFQSWIHVKNATRRTTLVKPTAISPTTSSSTRNPIRTSGTDPSNDGQTSVRKKNTSTLKRKLAAAIRKSPFMLPACAMAKRENPGVTNCPLPANTGNSLRKRSMKWTREEKYTGPPTAIRAGKFTWMKAMVSLSKISG